MLKFTNKTRSLIVLVGAVMAVLALANVAVADEGQSEPGVVAEATVEVLPVHTNDNATPAEEPILEPGDSQTVAVVHDLPPAITPAPNPDEEPLNIGETDTVITVNSHLGVPGGVEPAAGVVDEPVLGPPGTESIGTAESTGWSIADWAGTAAILVAIVGAIFGGRYVFNQRRLDEALAN